MPIHLARNLCNSVRKSWVWQLLCHNEESHMWYCTSGDSACTFSRKQKTAARTAPKQYRKIQENPNLLPEYNTKISICIIRVWHHSLPPLTMKFKRWNTFWVVQPYSGTRSSIRISWICKQQFVSYWGKENSQVVESDIEITFNKFKQHKCKGLKLNFWKQPYAQWNPAAGINSWQGSSNSFPVFCNLNGGITKLRCVCNLCPGQTIPKSLRLSCTRHYKP
jgi:hypothetical protein